MNLGNLGLCQVLKGTIVAVFPKLLPLYFTVQFFGSTIQGSISDIYKRSTILNLALVILIIFPTALLLTHNSHNIFSKIIQFSSAVFIALGGNADVVGRASIIDIRYQEFRRKVMSLTVFAEAFSWVIIGFFIRYFHLEPINILITCIASAVLLLVISLLYNIDQVSDKKELHNPIHEMKLILKSHYQKFLGITLILIFVALGYFYFFYSQEDSITKNDTVKNKIILADTYLSWFISMSLGCFLPMHFKKFTDFTLLAIGIFTIFLGVCLFIFTGMKPVTSDFIIDTIAYFTVGLGSGICLPSFYSIISNGQSIHFQGILTGWIDSIRGFGDAFSTLTLVGISSYLNLATYLSCSFLILSLIVLFLYRNKIQTS